MINKDSIDFEDIVISPEAQVDKDCTPEEALVYAIIQSGVEDQDQEYLNGALCELHCQLVGFDVSIIRENI